MKSKSFEKHSYTLMLLGLMAVILVGVTVSALQAKRQKQ